MISGINLKFEKSLNPTTLPALTVAKPIFFL